MCIHGKNMQIKAENRPPRLFPERTHGRNIQFKAGNRDFPSFPKEPTAEMCNSGVKQKAPI